MKKALEELIEELNSFYVRLKDNSKKGDPPSELEFFNLRMIVELQRILLDDLNQPKEDSKIEPTPDLVEWILQVEGRYHSTIELRSDIMENLDELTAIEYPKDQFSVFNIFKDNCLVRCNDDLKVMNLSLKPDTNKEELFEDKEVLIPIWHNNIKINEVSVNQDASDEYIRARVASKESFMLILYANMGIPYEVLIETNVLGKKYAIIIQKRVK
jgi:hypothetical protein